MSGGRVAIANFARPVSLTVSTTGSGAGVVTSTPPGIDCGTDCTEDYLSGTTVALIATSSAGSVFSDWGGACTGTANPCVVTMDGARSVTASFNPAATLTVAFAGSGTGTVLSSPAGIHCGGDCSEVYAIGATVTLAAFPATGVLFSGWGGACAGQIDPCTLTMTADQSVTATFMLAVTPPAP
jgi:hypothetical protein